MRRTFFLIIAISFFIAPSGLANEILRFKKVENKKENSALEEVYKTKPHKEASYKIAAIDLNDDFISEYVLTPGNTRFCEENRLCPYYVVVFAKNEPIIIGQFDAHKILISNKKTYGIRNIIVYNDVYNDFQNRTARWNPFSFRYQPY